MRTGRRLVVALAFALLGFGIAAVTQIAIVRGSAPPPAVADNTALRV